MRALHWMMPIGFATLIAVAGCGGDDETGGNGGSTTSSGTGGSTSSGTGGTGGSTSSGTGGSTSSGTGGSTSSGTGGSTSSGTGGTGGTGGQGGSCVAPDVPSTPAPADAATDVDPDATTSVSWADSAGADTYDVYFSDTCPPPSYPDAAFQTVNAATLDALTLAINSSYCWQVVAVSADPSCYAEGPVWGFDTGCNDAVAGPPDVISGDALYQPGTTAGTYPLTFSEDVYDVAANVAWTPVIGTGTMDAVNQIDGQNYDVDFSGVADGDLYTLTIDTGVTDFCGNAVVAQVDIAISILDSGLTCAQATDLTFQTFPYTLTGTFDDDPAEGGSCDATPTNAVWFSYTAPNAGWYDISAVNNTSTGAWSRLAVFDGTGCSPLGSELECVTTTNKTPATQVYLSQGQSVLILFHTDGDSYTMVDPEITIAEITFASGEECSTPIDLSSETFPYTATGTFDYELAAGGSCDATPTNMVWFSYTPANSDWYSISATNATSTNAFSRLAVWEGDTCDPHDTQIACVTASSKSATATPLYLTQGVTYLIAFYTDGNSYTMVDPEITIATVAAPNAGEVCLTSVDVSAEAFPYTLTGTFDYDGPGGSCDTTANNMVWFDYTPSSSDWYSVSSTNATATAASSRLVVWEGGGCAPLGPEVSCVAVSGKTATASPLYLTQGQTYLIGFYTSGETYTMVDPQITITTTAPPLPGEMCISAVDLSAETFPYSLTGTFTNDGPGGSCDATATNIVWYTYTPTVTQDYTISGVNYTGTLAYSRLAIFETASCNPYGAQVACVTSSNKTPSTTVTLTQGVTYLIAFYTDGESYTMIDPDITITP